MKSRKRRFARARRHHSPEELVDKLVAAGYVREDPVGAVGEFSMRGGILDVWSPGQDAGAHRIFRRRDRLDPRRSIPKRNFPPVN